VLAGFEPLPNWCHDVKYRGMNTLEVYRLLQEDPSESGGASGGSGGGDPMDDLRQPGESEPEKSQAEVKQEIKANITSAAVAAKMKGDQAAGSIPADVQVFLDSLLKPKLPMAAHLRKFFNAIDKSNYSWQKLNRRFHPMLMPGLQGKKLGHIAFAFDMSSSVSDKDIQRYVSELMGVVRNLKPEKITLVQFTCEIKSVTRLKTVRELAALELRGRGGTDIEPLMEWAKLNKPTALCVFTDGEYSHPSFNPGCPVMWLIHGYSKDMFHCDFGTTIRFDVNDDPF
jgi:predicted metal-dependent peptidase